MVLSSQQSLAPVIGVTGSTLTVTAGGTLVTPQTSSGVAVLPALLLLLFSLSRLICDVGG